MGDLSEHLLANPDIIWAWRGLTTLLVVVAWYFIRLWIRRVSKDQDGFLGWKIEADKKGGVVTRNDHFDWCKQFRDNCPYSKDMAKLMTWKGGIMEKGGVLTPKDHTAICEKISERYTDRIEEVMTNHKIWVEQQIEINSLMVERVLNAKLEKWREDLKRNGVMNK